PPSIGFFFQAEDGIRDFHVTGVQTCALPIYDYDIDPVHMRSRYGPEVAAREVVDRRWSGGRILTLDGYPHRGQPICLSEFGGIEIGRASCRERVKVSVVDVSCRAREGDSKAR